MKTPVLMSLIIFMSIGRILAVETDPDYNQGYAKNAFKKADKNKDGKLTAEDAKTWNTYKAFDADNDAVVTEEELCAKAEDLYEVFPGHVKRNIIYKRVGDLNLLIDMYYPPTTDDEKMPLLVRIHGGGWQSGAKELSRDDKPVIAELLKQGIACASINYRLLKTWRDTDPVVMRDCVVDCHDAMRFLKKNADELKIDPNKVIAFGGSAGGHLAQMVTWSDPDAFPGDPALAEYKLDILAGISWSGPSDFRDQDLFVVPEGVKKEYEPWHWSNRITKYSGNTYESKDPQIIAAIKEVSPVVYLTKDSAPLLEVHGNIDAVIPVKHAWHLKKKAEEVGANVEIVIAQDAWHGWGNGRSKPSPAELRQLTVEYAQKQFGKAR